MNTRLVNSAAGVILAALTQNRTAAGIALAMDSAGLLMSPETAAELERLRIRLSEYERPVDEEPITYSLTAEASCGRALSTGRPCPDHPRQPVEPLIVSRFDAAMEPAIEEEPVLTIGAIAEDGSPVALLLDVEDRRKVGGWLTPVSTVFRASHDSIVMGHYTTATAAREHCEALVRREYPGRDYLQLWWREDEDTVDQPEFGPAELIESTAPHYSRPTGYLVTPVEVASAYDPDADE